MAKLTSQLCGELQPAICLSRGYVRSYLKVTPSTCEHLTGLRNKPQQKQPR